VQLANQKANLTSKSPLQNRLESLDGIGFNNAFFYSEPKQWGFGQEAVFRQSPGTIEANATDLIENDPDPYRCRQELVQQAHL
jgi:hypothetical protein